MPLRLVPSHWKQAVFLRLPTAEGPFYRFCKYYVDRVRGENNGDPASNGEYRVLAAVAARCRVFFDVGANVGAWSQSVLELNALAIVHAFEPSARTCARLEKRLGTHPRVVIRNFALAAASGDSTLYTYGDTHSASSLYLRPSAEGLLGVAFNTEHVRTITIDEYCRNEVISGVDYLKVDVEGHDLEVLRGATSMLRDSCIRYIQFEYGSANLDSRTYLRDFFELLLPFGYRLYKILQDRLQAQSEYRQSLENFQYQNWLAVRNGEWVPE